MTLTEFQAELARLRETREPSPWENPRQAPTPEQLAKRQSMREFIRSRTQRSQS